MHSRPRLVGAFVALAGAALVLLPARTVAQCSDPAVPQGGFALATLLNPGRDVHSMAQQTADGRPLPDCDTRVVRLAGHHRRPWFSRRPLRPEVKQFDGASPCFSRSRAT